MSEILLNKFEKEKNIIELYKEGKTTREIAKKFIYHLDISNIITN